MDPGNLVATRLSKEQGIAIAAGIGIATHLLLRFSFHVRPQFVDFPLFLVLSLGGLPLLLDLAKLLLKANYSSDLLAGISIVTSIAVGEYLVGCIVVLMLSGGTALEQYAMRRASFALDALARRMPPVAHRRRGDDIEDVPLDAIAVGDAVTVLPHEICPVDGAVIEGSGVMDESYLTGEPYRLEKAPGSDVFSGAVNGATALLVRAKHLAVDSRYARIMQVMEESAQRRPQIRRIAERLGAWYTPLALLLAVAAWAASNNAGRFLAVLVIATPCPLLIAIPVAIVGAISLSARRGIILKNPAAAELVPTCRTIIFDKTGTLTYGRPQLTDVVCLGGYDRATALKLTASLARFSRHPLAQVIFRAAEQDGIPLLTVKELSEQPGTGLRGMVDGHVIEITGRKIAAAMPAVVGSLPPFVSGMESIVLRDGQPIAHFRFHDEPRPESQSFIGHLGPKHMFSRIVLLSGDRETEVVRLAGLVGIKDVHYSKNPEEKLEIVRAESNIANTLFVGDGINDAPAMLAATVGVALGAHDVTAETADVVILDASLEKVDELFHISRRMRRMALQGAAGGMGLSIVGMLLAALGLLPPLSGALAQEAIDLLAVINAVRMVLPQGHLTDFEDASA